MIDFDALTINELLNSEFSCQCGKSHKTDLKAVYDNITNLREVISKYNVKKAYVVCDKNTYSAAGKITEQILKESNIIFKFCMLDNDKDRLEPCEKAVGQVVMEYQQSDIIIALGSGTINDICKFLKLLTRLPYVIVATAPSMDGYASNSSSMLFGGVKTTISSSCPDVIIADPDILNTAPEIMKLAGIGDILAKYVSVCEWRISNIVTGEYYCERIAKIMRKCATECFLNAEAFLAGDKEAVKSVTNGLIKAGIAMAFAEISRPASGTEHYYSHLWEMKSIENGTCCQLHGIQVGLATLEVIKKYNEVKKIIPDKKRGTEFVKNFNTKVYFEKIREYFGTSAEKILALEEKEQKYNKETHSARLERIIKNWNQILEIINDEMPQYSEMLNLYKKIGFPTEYAQIGESEESANEAFIHTKDIRDKYILSRLLWDLGYDKI